MSLIQNLKIRDKLLVLLLILLLPLLYFLINSFIFEIEERNKLKEINNKLEETEYISTLVHELQKERTLIYGYVNSKGRKFAQELILQQKKTDVAISKIEDFQEENNSRIKELKFLTEWESFRKQAFSLKLDTVQFDNYTANFLDNSINRISDVANKVEQPNIRENLLANNHLISLKVNLGKLRTLVSRIYTYKTISYFEYNLFGTIKSHYYQNTKNFTRLATPEILERYYTIYNRKDGKEINQYLLEIEKDPFINLENYNPDYWVDISNSVIEELRELEIYSITSIRTVFEKQIEAKERNLIIYSIVTFLILFLTIALAIVIIKSITNAITTLRDVSEKLSLGYTDINVNIYSKDELGDLAQSFNKIIDKNVKLSVAANEIGQGKYDVAIPIYSKKDILAASLSSMKDNLEQFSTETKNRDWTLSGLSKLNDLMSGGMEIKSTTSKVINFLSHYINASLGAIYLFDDKSSFRFSAGFAVDTQSDIHTFSFKEGEGLLGEVVANQKLAVLDAFETQDLKVSTGIVEKKPIQLLICPVIFNGTVVGVIELASFNKYTDLQIEFCENAAERISIVISTIKSSIRTQDLLAETQAQSEELQAQQEELRQANIELKAQADHLQVSEEELKASQEELEEKNLELQEKAKLLEDQFQNLSDKNLELEQAKQAIELKMNQVETISKYKTEFLANMSHELRTPLNSILILSKLLEEDSQKMKRPDMSKNAKVINDSGTDLLKLINEILDLSKIESGHINLELKPFSPRDIKVDQNFYYLAKEKNIDFHSIVDPSIPASIVTDKFRVEQILKNLLSNAFKFTPNGGKIEFRIFVPPSNGNFIKDNLIAFSVKDTGIGIPKEKQDLVFEAFQQADTSTTRKFGGTGLGLSICRELAKILGGEIHLESEIGKGSDFTLYLPQQLQKPGTNGKKEFKINIPTLEKQKEVKQAAVPAIPIQVNVEQADEKDGQENLLVLIIEDDKAFNNILADFAKAKRFEVLQAFNGADGLALLNQHRPDALLLDIQLPDMTGWDILDKIKNERALRRMKVHVMSAYDKEVVDRKGIEKDFLSKPVTLEKLDKAFSQIIKKSSHLEKVLIVEDNHVENDAIAQLLLSHNIKAEQAYDGKQALDIIEREKIDSVILDLRLPDMEGYKVMEEIRESKKETDLPIIIYSGKDLSEEEENKLKKYANTIIIKNEYSYMRLLDEVKLFLHKMSEKLSSIDKFLYDVHTPGDVLKGKTVLIVDDDIRNIYSLHSVLDRQGINIVIANDGKEALDKLKEEPNIEMVLMDVMMPEMDGLECTKRIRQNPLFKNLPIIALTAKAMKEDKENAIKAGASDYITKPVDIDKLLSLMRVWLYDGVKR